LPSGLLNGVGTPNSLISRLNSPACTTAALLVDL
jgi:hypothetical protein